MEVVTVIDIMQLSTFLIALISFSTETVVTLTCFRYNIGHHSIRISNTNHCHIHSGSEAL